MKQDSAAPHNRAAGLSLTQIWQISGPRRAAIIDRREFLRHIAGFRLADAGVTRHTRGESFSSRWKPRFFQKGALMTLLARPFLAATALLMAPLCSLTGARSEGLDLTRASCADFAAMNENDQTQLSLWLAGYFAGSAMRPVLDLEKITAAPAGLTALCAKSPQLPLVGAETRAVFMPAPAP